MNNSQQQYGQQQAPQPYPEQYPPQQPPPQYPPPQYPPQQYPPQQYPPQQYPPQQYPPQQPQYGPPGPPKKKSKLPLILGIIVIVVVVVVVLAVVFMFVLKPGVMTATQVLDDYDSSSMNFRSFGGGDTVTIRDKILDKNEFGTTTFIYFDYTGTKAEYTDDDTVFMTSGNVDQCNVGEYITIKGTVTSVLGYETIVSWEVSDTSGC